MEKWILIVNEMPDFIRECFYKEWEQKDFKKCSVCENILPQHKLFFIKNYCKECKGQKFINMHTIKIFKNYIPLDMKYCGGCSIILPKDSNHFNKNSDSSDGFYSKCKKCRGFKNYGETLVGTNTKLAKEHKKMCKYCKKVKNLSSFPKVRNTQYTIAQYCSDCKYIFDEEEILRRGSRKGLKSNYDRKYYLKNREKRLKYYKDWKSTEHGKAISTTIEQKRIARKKDLFSDLTLEQWERALFHFNNSCAYCGISNIESLDRYKKKLNQEHIIPVVNGGSHSDFNIIPSCTSCNSKKNKKDLETFYEENNNFTVERYLIILDYFLSCV